MPVVRPFYQDPFKPVLFNSPPLVVTQEQLQYIEKILERACSDSRFAEKAFASILIVLTQGNTPLPTVTSLSPSTVKIGEPYFDIHVHGTGFDEGSKIVFNGYEEVTVRVSDTELTTGVNMPLWSAPAVVPIEVINSHGVLSNAMTFEFLPADELVGLGTSSQKVVRK